MFVFHDVRDRRDESRALRRITTIARSLLWTCTSYHPQKPIAEQVCQV